MNVKSSPIRDVQDIRLLFMQYAAHLPNCSWHKSYGNSCDCGYDELVTELASDRQRRFEELAQRMRGAAIGAAGLLKGGYGETAKEVLREAVSAWSKFFMEGLPTAPYPEIQNGTESSQQA